MRIRRIFRNCLNNIPMFDNLIIVHPENVNYRSSITAHFGTCMQIHKITIGAQMLYIHFYFGSICFKPARKGLLKRLPAISNSRVMLYVILSNVFICSPEVFVAEKLLNPKFWRHPFCWSYVGRVFGLGYAAAGSGRGFLPAFFILANIHKLCVKTPQARASSRWANPLARIGRPRKFCLRMPIRASV